MAAPAANGRPGALTERSVDRSVSRPEVTMMPRKACFSRSGSMIALLAMSMQLGVAHAVQRELKEVRVAYPPSMASVTLMTGIQQRFFEEQGLNPTLLVIASDLALK